MMKFRNTLVAASTAVVLAVTPLAHADSAKQMLISAISGDHRGDASRHRDRYRHPLETLEFFGWQPAMSVLEVSPGAGWYTEVLAAASRSQGQLFAAGFALTADDLPSYGQRVQMMLLDKMEARPDVYDHVVVTELSVPQRVTPAPPESMDMVVTFRNVHSWMRQDEEAQMAQVFFRALKPGGILGVTEHRAKPGTPREQMVKSGYVTEQYTIDLFEKAGFVFEAKSEVNANPDDTADHPMGVWSLPPSLRGCKKIEAEQARRECEQKYRAIGESDRMTLRFKKP